MAKKSVVFPDTSLCAIVRDEKMNPAGGIERFVDSHVPFVEQAVIADTGSVDGTREILEEMQSKYPNLKVVDIPFEGYADARNKTMKHVQTKRVLILDADELLTHKKPQNDWKLLKRFIDEKPANSYDFEFLSILPSGFEYFEYDSHTTRLFDISKRTKFIGFIGEFMSGSRNSISIPMNSITIKHFVPSLDALNKKNKNWYSNLTNLNNTAPSQIKGFAEWKAFNPLRDEYI